MSLNHCVSTYPCKISRCCHSSTSGEPSDPVYTDKGLRKRGGDCSIDPFPLENAKLTTFTTQSSGQDLRRFFDEVNKCKQIILLG